MIVIYLMYNKLIRCGSIIIYIQKDLENKIRQLTSRYDISNFLRKYVDQVRNKSVNRFFTSKRRTIIIR
jgi:hypothetical protein